MRFLHIIALTLCLFITIHSQSVPMYLQIANNEILTDQQQAIIYKDDTLNEVYDESIYDDSSNCKNGKLIIVNNSRSGSMIVKYYGLPTINESDIQIISEPNQQPQSQAFYADQTKFAIYFNCPNPSTTKITSDNFWNKIRVSIRDVISFTFLLDCDPDNRHKQFEYGYLIISLINAAITIGVAMHSYVWSIKIQYRPLRYHLKWVPFLVFSLIGIAIVVGIYFFATNNFIQAFIFVKYAGIAISVFFVFICFNEIFYLMKELRKPVFKSIRICQIFSAVFTITVTLLAVFFQNWILYDFIAGFICIGSIKIFHFTTLKDAFISMGIMILTVTSIAISLHYLLPLSYNDYANELSSPLFFQVPDLINSLFKKCSWLPIIDVILPGITLSYLRLYDQNRSSKWGGVYTISGNFAFVLSTILWIGLQLVYPFSVPFSLVTYPFLMATVFIIAWRRNEWHTLIYGLFQQGYDTITASMLEETKRSFSKHISQQAISDVLVNSDKDGSSIIDE